MPEIEYDLIRSRRKTISITVTQEASVVVRAPLRTPKSVIAGFVDQKQRWILEKRELAQQRAEAHKPGEFLSGEEFPYLGRMLMLAVSANARRIERCGDTLVFPQARLTDAEALLKRWYAQEARRVLADKLEACRRQTGIAYSGFGITNARRRWGSCGSNGSLNFTWRLVMAPPDVIDYVVVHELAHIEHPDHSKAFWARVGEIMPDYKAKQIWLRDNSALLRLL